MGIKFRCPNGHKLHVKAFLSGKRAICPKCGVSVLVPAPDELQIGAAPRFAPVSLVSSSVPGAAPTAAAASDLSDPIAAEPDALWYVRPASGGQFGPASGEVLRQWIESGRVGPGTLVWHEGWPEWRTAVSTFPQLAGLPAAPPVATAIPLAEVDPRIEPHRGAPGIEPRVEDLPATELAGSERAIPEPAPRPLEEEMSVFRPPRKRPPKSDSTVIASSILVVVSIILVIVLVVVFNYRSTTDETTGTGGQTVLE